MTQQHSFFRNLPSLLFVMRVSIEVIPYDPFDSNPGAFHRAIPTPPHQVWKRFVLFSSLINLLLFPGPLRSVNPVPYLELWRRKATISQASQWQRGKRESLTCGICNSWKNEEVQCKMLLPDPFHWDDTIT